MAPHTRVRTGCWTCRDAGYKCDEKRPHCGRCTRLNITCQGYGVRLKWRNAAADNPSEKRPRKTKRKAPLSETSSPSPNSDVSSIASAPAILERAGRDSSQSWALTLSPTISSGIALDLCRRDKRLFHYWTDQLSSLISATPRNTHRTPFQIHLTAMACNYGALRSTILCMAATHLALVSNDASMRIQAYRHQRDAIRLLQDIIQDPIQDADSESALATVLMMQVFARLFGEEDEEPHIANHLIGAKAMILRKGTSASWTSSSSARFLLSLFAYHDILASVSRGSRPLLDHTYEFAAVEDVASLEGIARVLHVVAQVSEMQHIPASLSRQSLVCGSELQKELDGMEFSALDASPDILLTSRAYRHAAFIYLYRVWLGIGAPNPNTLNHVAECLSCIKEIPVESSLASAHTWPLFTAGCEALDSAQRQFVRHRFQAMYQLRRFPSLRRIMRDVEEVWKAKDMEHITGGLDRMSRVDCIQVILRSRGREVDLA